jgi:hypothetical protein
MTPLGWVLAVSLTLSAALLLFAIVSGTKLLVKERRLRVIARHRLIEEGLLQASGACGHGLPGLVTRKGCDCNGRSAL